MNELEMKIEPSFLDQDNVIVFSFDFMSFSNKIGEGVVYTYSEHNHPHPLTYNSRECFDLMPVLKNQNGNIAVIHDLTILEEYKEYSMKKMLHFLKIIGISKVYFANSISNIAVG
ncbi:hypothetical protein [Falsibacillus pallidus]|uniref:Uncharacterized protein n=1 Tax=Falsibacillus pallidus TaxID=493781 RepID=A0A370G8P9_9BACI|nr:hypothetical protein [Falsibacillus pallidus]RDI40151.1 hypothetical protein DFR59_11267 [Falsibacillus pallidus]